MHTTRSIGVILRLLCFAITMMNLDERDLTNVMNFNLDLISCNLYIFFFSLVK
jgi:hypothetical protein